MQFNKKLMLLFMAMIVLHKPIFCQNYIQDFRCEHKNNKINFTIKAIEQFSYDLQPFDTRAYTLIKLFPLQFAEGEKENYTKMLQKLPTKIHAIELKDHSIMLTFKGIVYNQINVTLWKKLRMIEISAALPANVSEDMSIHSAKGHLEIAKEYEQKNHNEKAIQAIHKALKLKPAYAEAYFLAGVIRFKHQQYKMAHYNFNKALQLDKNMVEAKAYLRKMRILQQKSEDETDLSATIVEREPKFELKEQKDVDAKNHQTQPEINVADSNKTSSATPLIKEPMQVADQHEIQPLSSINLLQKNYMQLGLFSLIVSSVLGWIGLIIYKGIKLKHLKRKHSANFAEVLKKYQHSPIEKSKPNQVLSSTYENTAATNNNYTRNYSPSAYEEKKIPKFRNSFDFRERASDKGNESKIEDGFAEKVFEYASYGYSVEEIAKQLNAGKGEVQLLLTLSGREIPPTSQDIRIEMG